MNDIAAALEATALAQFLKSSRWVYPFVNAGHILGIALLIGAVVPLDLTLAGILRRTDPVAATRLLRPIAVAGLALAAGCGVLLFVTQASDYLRNPIFQAKMILVAAALLNAVLYSRIGNPRRVWCRASALLSLALWPIVLLLGRFVGYSLG